MFHSIGARVGREGDPLIGLFRQAGGLAKGIYLRPWMSGEMQLDSGGAPGAIDAPIGVAKDISGNGADASQATLASRPMLRTQGPRRYLEFDGADDFLATAAINFTGTDKITVVAGVLNGNTALGMIVELTNNFNGNAGSFCIAPRNAANGDYGFGLKGDVAGGSGAFRQTPGAVRPFDVVSVRFDIAQATREDEITPRLNGVVPSLTGSGVTDSGGGNFSNSILYVGRRNGTALPFKGRLFGLLVIGRLLSDNELMLAEWFMAARIVNAFR